MLFLPTLLGTFTLYACSRSHDISWGNRMGKIDEIQEDISNDSATILLFVNLVNIVLEFCVINWSDKLSMLILMLILITPLILQLVVVLLVFLYRHLTCTPI